MQTALELDSEVKNPMVVMTVVSIFDLERNSFPVTVESGEGAEGMEEDTLFLSMTPKLGQIMPVDVEYDVCISRQ